nr:mitochondrial ribosome-associated GTPase 1 isoform X12 [Manis javanica]
MRLPARSLCGAAGAAWRERFPLGGRDVARWFPGHMAKGLKKMQSSLKLVDCIIEVHDARISFENFTTLRRRRPTKCHFYQLCKGCKHQAGHPDGHGIGWEQLPLSPRREPGGLCPGGRGPKCGQVLPHQLAQETAPQESPFNCAGKATRVGGEPGITRAVMSRIQVCERPLTFLLDTPGVLAPRIESVETGLKLALCGTVLDHLVGEETLADYLLYTLNRHQLFGALKCTKSVLAVCPPLSRPRCRVLCMWTQQWNRMKEAPVTSLLALLILASGAASASRGPHGGPAFLLRCLIILAGMLGILNSTFWVP